jgi:hypothetical protein
MNITWKRTLRTPSSERFLALRDGREVAAIDMHYMDQGVAAGTVVLLDDAGWKDGDIPAFLQALDNDLLPGVDLDTGNLVFSVVVGRLVGNFEADSGDGKSA